MVSLDFQHKLNHVTPTRRYLKGNDTVDDVMHFYGKKDIDLDTFHKLVAWTFHRYATRIDCGSVVGPINFAWLDPECKQGDVPYLLKVQNHFEDCQQDAQGTDPNFNYTNDLKGLFSATNVPTPNVPNVTKDNPQATPPPANELPYSFQYPFENIWNLYEFSKKVFEELSNTKEKFDHYFGDGKTHWTIECRYLSPATSCQNKRCEMKDFMGAKYESSWYVFVVSRFTELPQKDNTDHNYFPNKQRGIKGQSITPDQYTKLACEMHNIYNDDGTAQNPLQHTSLEEIVDFFASYIDNEKKNADEKDNKTDVQRAMEFIEDEYGHTRHFDLFPDHDNALSLITGNTSNAYITDKTKTAMPPVFQVDYKDDFHKRHSFFWKGNRVLLQWNAIYCWSNHIYWLDEKSINRLSDYIQMYLTEVDKVKNKPITGRKLSIT